MYGMEKYILLFICSLLLLVSVGSKGKGKLPIVVLDFPLDFNFAGAEFEIELSFRTKSKRRLSLEVTSTGTQSKKFREFKYDAIVAHRTEVTQKLKVTILLRDSLAYLEKKIIDVQPDLYTDEIQVTGLLLDDLRGGLYSKTVLAGDFLRLPLVPPWSRPKKPGFTFLWEQLLKINQPKVEKCQNLRDIVDLITFPVALTGKETGVKRTVPPLVRLRKELEEEHSRSKPRFTVSTWIFMSEPCFDGLCGILNHRSTELLTPLLSITSNSTVDGPITGGL